MFCWCEKPWHQQLLCWPGARPTNDISIEFETTIICSALVYYVLCESQRNFAHVTTVELELSSWRVQNFIVIGYIYFKLEHSKFWSNFEFDRNIVSGMGARFSWNFPIWPLDLEWTLTFSVTKNQAAGTPNMNLWDLKTGALIRGFVQKKSFGWWEATNPSWFPQTLKSAWIRSGDYV